MFGHFTILFAIWLVAIFWIFLLLKPAVTNQNSVTQTHKLPTFSIIVAARNEEKNIEHLLNSITQLDYPNNRFELILALDLCIDKTEQRAETRLKNSMLCYQILKCNLIPQGWFPKKFAVWSAAQKAQSELLIFTDADCLPPKTWLSEYATAFQTGADIVLGYAPLVNKSSTFATKLSQVDSLFNGVLTAFGVGVQNPFMNNGRNWALKKSIYLQSNPLSTIKNRVSGDDDLTLQRITTSSKLKTHFLTAKNTQVPSTAPITFSQYFRRRGRHVSVGDAFPLSLQLGLIFYYLMICLMFYLPIGFAFGQPFHFNILIFPLVFSLSHFFIFRYVANVLAERLHFLDFLKWQVVTLPLSFFAWIYFLFNRKRW